MSLKATLDFLQILIMMMSSTHAKVIHSVFLVELENLLDWTDHSASHQCVIKKDFIRVNKIVKFNISGNQGIPR